MYRDKRDIDKHVDTLMYKLTSKDFQVRACSVARLYYDVGDYKSCQKYVEQYLSLKSNNAPAHKLLGQTFQKLGQKTKALEQYIISVDLDPSQTTTLLDICELLADEDVVYDTGRTKYFLEKTEAIYPKHPITFRLHERVLIDSKSDPERVVKLIKVELESRPRDAVLHARLLKHFLQHHRIGEAFDHSCDLEFEKNFFSDNYSWYECLSEVLKHNPLNSNDWLYQLLLLTVKERMCCLCLREVPNSSGKSLLECSDQLSDYDQAIDNVVKSGYTSGFAEFHTTLIKHHKGQLALHAATLLLKKAKKDQLSMKEAQKYSIPLMLIAWQSVPLLLCAQWLAHAPDKQRNAIRRHYVEGSYRCSQSGHYLLSNIQDKSQILLDQVSQVCSDVNWKDKLYEKLYTAPDQPSKKDSSYLYSNLMETPALRFPGKAEVQAYDDDAQREYGNSLHHFVWMLLNYKNFAEFKCTMFDMLKPKMTSCGPETLNKIDILAFLFSATLTTRKQKENRANLKSAENSSILPSNITDLLCSLPQIKWWNCVYKFSQNDFGSDYTDIRSTLSQGIEVIRCVDNHGLDAELLCMLGRIFAELSNKEQYVEGKTNFGQRACLYYSSAINLLEKIKNKVTIRLPERRLFDYTHKDMDPKELNSLIEESKLYVALNHLKDGEYEKVICLLSHLKSPQAYYHLSKTYKKIAGEEKSFSKNADSENQCKVLLEKAKTYAYKAFEKVKELEMYKNNTLYTEIQENIEDIERWLTRINSEFSSTVTNDESSDETISEIESLRNKPNAYRNVSSTPKQITRHSNNANATNYRTATDSHLLESTAHFDSLVLERIENQIKNLQKKDLTINNFMEQTKDWFDENKKLGNKIMNTIKSNIENTTEQFKMLKISVNELKEQIDESRNESKDVGDLKKQIAELKKEVNKLKKTTEQAIDENDVYNLDEDYRGNENTSTFAAQLPFPTPQPFGPPFAQRIGPPFSIASNPYQLYGQNLYNLYNQYSQIAQSSTVQGAPPIFDPTRAQMTYPGVFPTPDQMYLDVAHLPPTLPTAPNVPAVHNIPNMTTVAPATNTQSSTPISTSKSKLEVKEAAKSLPVNVVITSSDPLPTTTSTVAPVLSVTIPQKHIKGSPHNYQIPMPTSNVTKVVAPPVFSFAISNSTSTTATTITTNWNMKSIFKPDNTMSTTGATDTFKDSSKTVVDGVILQSSPNTSLNKSRTLSEKSNTSIENYDPCPDFKPIIPLPAEVKVTTGEEDELVIFSARAKLFRFVDKQWKERGIGEIKLLKHKVTGKVRVLMRREQVHKICANHIILPEMEIKPMKNETKAYFWVANDFAEETVILEKFCIKFKTADIAKEYYEEFEKARISSSSITPTDLSKKPSNIPDKTISEDISDVKTVVGGFTFSSKPSFKPVTEDSHQNTKANEATTNKVNVFTGLSFKPATSSVFSNLSSTTTPISTNKSTEKTTDTSKLNTSDLVEEFEPTVDFKPVIPLPALVDQKTGEEDEIVLFEHRAKLLRFDAAGKEWKERGLGNIKLLCHKDNNQKLRLVMRREQIMKVCCNVAVNKEMIFQKMPNMDKAVTFCAKDFSEGQEVAETFCLRFKTIQLCDDFINAVKTAQSQECNAVKAVKGEEKAAKQKVQTGFGDKFKPQVGSWECKECLIRNEADKDHCCACNSPKDPTAKKADKSLLSDSAPKFNFGIPSIGAQTVINPPTTIGWGDKFKAKEGTWECKQCYIRNESSSEQCSACNNPKNPDVVSSKSEVKFSFGIMPKANEPIGTGQKASTFSFGISQEKTLSFGVPTTKSSNIFNAPKITGENDRSTNFGLKKNDEESITVTPMKPALLPTPKLNTTPFGKEGGTFEFSFNKQNVTKGKSPLKSPKDKTGDESDDNEYASEDEGHHIHFSPVIPMPDKIKVVTGEESELELYGHRAKLFIFVDAEWKERGIGIVKILKHKENGKLRVLMRREQVHKICLNHALNRDVVYKPKDEKSWFFFANDFSEGEILLQNFCLRFQNKEVALQFKDAIDNAIGITKKDLGTTAVTETTETKNDTENKATDSDDVEFINEIQASNEDKQKARDLMLPENFFNYVNKDPCQGCRGCDEEDKKIISTNVGSKSIQHDPVTTTPMRSSTASILSPAPSLYRTPSNLERTIDNNFDTPVFRTPLGAIGSNTKSIFTSANISTVENDLPDKENTLTESPGLKGSNTPLAFASGGKVSSIFGVTSKSSILAPPKLSVSNTVVGNNEKVESSTMFSTSEPNPLFGDKKPMPFDNKSVFSNTGVSTNQSIFGFISQNSKEDTHTSDSGSIFSSEKAPVNLFSGNSRGSIFGPAALQSNQSKPPAGFFSSVGTFTFGAQPSEKSIFAEKSSETLVQDTIFGKEKTSSSVNDAKKSTPEEAAAVVGEAPLKGDNALYFTALSSSGPGFAVQKETNFKWEGAGQQLFAKGSSSKEGDKTKNSGPNESGDVADDEYDPHYEPIVPLPDKIVITTGEEDEEKLFGERCKLFRFDESSRDWKERGVGEMKILYHPQKNSYRLLLRREQVHKAVLNMLLFPDLELLPMKNSETAWTWAGRNYADSAGDQETLAVRFKSIELATSFNTKIKECVRKLQVAAAEAIRQEKEAQEKKVDNFTPLRLPKHLTETARADSTLAASASQSSAPEQQTNDSSQEQDDKQKKSSDASDMSKQVHFETEEDNAEDYDEEDYDNYYHEDSDGYYNEDKEAAVYSPCSAVVSSAGGETSCQEAHVQVSFDQYICSPKILVVDSNTEEILADMLIHTDTEFQLNGDTCTWTGMDFTSQVSVEKTVAITFGDNNTALEFYYSCETSKASTYASTDPE